MIIFTINEPRPFFSYLDEKNFFTWLESIPAVKHINGSAKGLEISLATPLNESHIRDLIAIMHRYGIEKKPLQQLCTSENESWFKDKNKYWYQSVFE